MYEVSFKGNVIDKLYCKKCGVNKYQLKLQLEEFVYPDKFPGKKCSYYSFGADSLLIISVSKQIFDTAEKSHTIRKMSRTYGLSIESRELHYLSEEKDRWFSSVN